MAIYPSNEDAVCNATVLAEAGWTGQALATSGDQVFDLPQPEAHYARPSCPSRYRPSLYADSCECRLYVQWKTVRRGIAGGATCV